MAMNDIPYSKVHGAHMGHIWDDRTQVGPMLAPWNLLSEIIGFSAFFCLTSFFFHTEIAWQNSEKDNILIGRDQTV